MYVHVPVYVCVCMCDYCTRQQSILIQVRAEIMSDKNAQLDVTPDREYSDFEAKDAFERMVRRYGWNK